MGFKNDKVKRLKDLRHLKLLSAAIRENFEEVRNLARNGEFDVKDFADFLTQNKLAGYFYSILNQFRLTPEFPEDFINRIKPLYVEQWRSNEKLIREMLELKMAAQLAGCEILFLKGPFLAQRFYGDIDRRNIADIDILVKSVDDIAVVERLLLQRGFVRQSKVFLRQNLTQHFTHHYEYKKPGFILELHWALQAHFSYRIQYERIWAEKKEFLLKDETFFGLSDSYVLTAIILSIFVDIQLGEVKLKSFVDIYMILKAIDKDIDWKSFFAAKREEGLFLISLNVLDLVVSLLDCRGHFKELCAFIDENRKDVIFQGLASKVGLLNYSSFGINAKSWAFRLYNASWLKSWVWWVISLPFKFSVYRKSNSRLQKSLSFLGKK